MGHDWDQSLGLGLLATLLAMDEAGAVDCLPEFHSQS